MAGCSPDMAVIEAKWHTHTIASAMRNPVKPKIFSALSLLNLYSQSLAKKLPDINT